MKVQTVKLGPFRGLNNISDPMTLGTDFLTVANNVNITDNKTVTTREGYSLRISSDLRAGITTKDYERLYAQDGLTIVKINDDFSMRVLCDLNSTDPVRFMEINKEIYFSNGIDSGLIKQDDQVYDWNWIVPEMPEVWTNASSGMMNAGDYQVIVTHLLMDGRETGASQAFIGFSEKGDQLVITGLTPMTMNVKDVLVYVKPPKSVVFQFLGYATGDSMTWSGDPNDLQDEILDEFNSPLPGSSIDFCLHKGQVAWMQYNEQHDTTFIWFSEPLIYHQFQNDSYLAIKGKGSFICSHSSGLIIGMRTEILFWGGENIDQLANFGAPPGYASVAMDDGTVIFWTDRGWCSGLPFVKLMDSQVSVSSAESVGTGLIERNGEKRVVAVLQSVSSPFNKRDV